MDFNFSVIEVWNFLDANNDDNDLVGVVMAPLHQFYTSFKVCTRLVELKLRMDGNMIPNYPYSCSFKPGAKSLSTPTCL